MAMLATGEEKKTTTPSVQTDTADQQGAAVQQPNAQTAAQQNTAPTVDNSKPSVQTPGTSSGTRTSGYDKAMQTLQAAEKTAPSFSSDYDETIADLYDKITSREPFRYDYSTDPLYGQYKEQYMQQGQQAMRDTMGQAAALTGGYGSSYGQAVGQQAYDAYLSRLNEVMPELYGQAYDVWQNEGDQLARNFQMAGAMRDTEYGQFRDAVGDKQYEDAWALQQAEAKAQAGDFSGYADIYGQDTADKMFANWAAMNPQLAYMQELITKDQYNNLMQGLPMNATRAAVAAGGAGLPSRSQSDLQRDQNARDAAAAVANGELSQKQADEWLAKANSHTRW